MRIANPKPSGTRRNTAPTRDEVNIGMGFPTLVGAPPIQVKALEAPMGPAPPRPGLNDTPVAQRERQDL